MTSKDDVILRALPYLSNVLEDLREYRRSLEKDNLKDEVEDVQESIEDLESLISDAKATAGR